MANHVERQSKTKPKCTLTRSHLPSITSTRMAWRTGRVLSCWLRLLLTCPRDLKPCNVLIFLPPNVDPDSRLGRATIGTCKLGDFGQCAIFEEAIMERVRCIEPLLFGGTDFVFVAVDLLRHARLQGAGDDRTAAVRADLGRVRARRHRLRADHRLVPVVRGRPRARAEGLDLEGVPRGHAARGADLGSLCVASHLVATLPSFELTFV
jgi:hypothetical protein